MNMRDYRLVIVCAMFVCMARCADAADAQALYGIHWWGYSGGVIDTNPAVMLDSYTNTGWDTETVVTHGDAWWLATYFQPLYADLVTDKNVSIITRIDYAWGQTVPSPTNPDYSNWVDDVVATVNALSDYCHIWIIGNEPNILGEGNGWPQNKITPSEYATIYCAARNGIHANADSSPFGEHIVLVAPTSPGNVIPGVRWMKGIDWLSQTAYYLPTNEVDGFAIHSYGWTVSEFHNTYESQLSMIDVRGFNNAPIYMTEFNRYATPGSASQEAASAQFLRDAFADLHAWNTTAPHHNVICACWFVYDADQQAGGGWDGYSIEYWRTDGNPLGSSNNLYTAFEQTVDLRYPAGIPGTVPEPVMAGVALAAGFIIVVARGCSKRVVTGSRREPT